MLSLLLSLSCSLAVGFYIKYLKIKNQKQLAVMVFVNYLVASLITYLLFDVSPTSIAFTANAFAIILVLGILMPCLFYVLNKSLATSGIAKTDIFQRLSLIIPVLLSFWLFNESFTYSKGLVILLAFVSILLLLYKKSTKEGNFNINFLLLVFLGYGTVDTLFKVLATNNNIPYISALFIIFIICTFISFIFLLIIKGKMAIKMVISGTVLGLLNFSNIYFYLRAHKVFADSPTLVFITMNLGVIIGGSLIGKFYFKERLNKTTILGILLAAISVILLALIQTKII